MGKNRYCPWCAGELSNNEKGLLACVQANCGFVHYNNPIGVVVAVIPMYHVTLGVFNLPVKGVPDGGLVCVKRKFPPHPGEWCLPCGFVDAFEHPKLAAERETKEETGLIVEAMENPILVCNSGQSNRIMMIYWASPRGGELKAGDDAEDVAVFNYDNMPKLCFPVHNIVVDNYWKGKYQ